jgi:lysophospholipase L1-like esterase
VPSYLKCVLLAKHLKVIDPDLIILSIGVNDAHGKNFSADAFRVNYESLIQMMKPALKDATILFTTNNDTYLNRKYPNRNALQVREVMFQLAEKYGYGVWDLYSIMGGLGSMSTWEREGLAASDRVHFTRAGYTLIGDLMFEAILKSYVNHLKSLKD